MFLNKAVTLTGGKVPTLLLTGHGVIQTHLWYFARGSFWLVILPVALGADPFDPFDPSPPDDTIDKINKGLWEVI